MLRAVRMRDRPRKDSASAWVLSVGLIIEVFFFIIFVRLAEWFVCIL